MPHRELSNYANRYFSFAYRNLGDGPERSRMTTDAVTDASIKEGRLGRGSIAGDEYIYIYYI